MMFRPGGIPQYGPSLAAVNQGHLMALSQQGSQSVTHEQLMEMQAAQQGMKQIAEKKNIEVPKVNFYPSRHPDPRKARKHDIRQGRRLLSPTKRGVFNPFRWVWGLKYRYNRNANQCVVDGCNVEELIRHDNLYDKICDEETSASLWDMYWHNPITGVPEAFIARENITDGRIMKGTYCPEHLHLYHLLCKWENAFEKDRMSKKSGMKEMVKKGVSTIAVPISLIKKKDNTPEFLNKYEPFFMELEKDSKIQPGISVLHYKNPLTQLNDVTMVVFDLRLFQKELEEMTPDLSEALGNLGIIQPNTTSPMVGQEVDQSSQGLNEAMDMGLQLP
jgi:hypothetical protein